MASLPVLAPRALPSVAARLSGSATSAILDASIERTGDQTLAGRPAQTIVVTSGQTVGSLAAQYHDSAPTLRWANGLTGSAEPAAGSSFLIPPSAGVLLRALPSETPGHFATRVGIDPSVLLDYNALSSDAPMAPGTYLMVPARLDSETAIPVSDVVPLTPGVPEVPSNGDNRSGANAYPYGQCTWYVASQRAVSWSGNADQWIAAARYIRPEGRVPVVNAIVVFDSGWVGHVGKVQQVNPDGSFVISEMNYYANGGGWGRVDERTIAANDPTIMGFIY